MSEAEARWEERLERMEALVNRALCKCVHGPYWVARNHCPIHRWDSPVFTPERKEDGAA